MSDVLGAEQVMEMAQMADAKASHLEDEDGIAVLHPADHAAADVRRDVPDADVTNFLVHDGWPALRIPAAQHVPDRRVRHVRVVR